MKLKKNFIQTTLIFVILFLIFFKVDISYNEMDVIPYGRSLYNSNWLSNDWYLNLKIPYRFLFSYPIGFFSDSFGFIKTIYIGRVISYIFIAISLNNLINTVNTSKSFIYYLLSVTIFFYFFRSGMGAGEWMVGGLDTKVFAYGFTLLSIAYFIKNDIKRWLLFSGLTISFHMLIGFYSLISFIPLILINRKYNRNSIKQLIKLSPILIISGLVGFYGIFIQLINIADNISNLGWDIYVNIRIPHHSIPSYFPRRIWLYITSFSLINILILIKTKIIKPRLLSTYALSTVGISFIGLAIFLVNESSSLLRYYFFRFSDIMLPLLTIISITYFVIEKANTYSIKAKSTIYYSTLLVTSIFYMLSMYKCYSDIRINSDTELYDLDMISWVKNNTDSRDGFIANPNSNMFYVNYERSIFVSWKHSPQNNNDIIEWYNRLKLLNIGNDFTTINEVTANYIDITETQVLSIQETYTNLRYVLVPKTKYLYFPVRHKSSTNTLYEITNSSKIDGDD